MDMIDNHPSQFVVNEFAASEITAAYTEQKKKFQHAAKAGVLKQVTTTEPLVQKEFPWLGKLTRLGAGERSAMAIALNHGYALAMDDGRAINRAIKEAGISDRNLEIVRTQDIVVQLIRVGYITVEEADRMLIEWKNNHRFNLRISSFSEILNTLDSEDNLKSAS